MQIALEIVSCPSITRLCESFVANIPPYFPWGLLRYPWDRPLQSRQRGTDIWFIHPVNLSSGPLIALRTSQMSTERDEWATSSGFARDRKEDLHGIEAGVDAEARWLAFRLGLSYCKRDETMRLLNAFSRRVCKNLLWETTIVSLVWPSLPSPPVNIRERQISKSRISPIHVGTKPFQH